MDEVIDALAIDRPDHGVADAVLHPYLDQLPDDESAPGALVIPQTRQEPQPMPMLTQEYRGIKDCAEQRGPRLPGLVGQRERRPSSTRLAASSSEITSSSSEPRARRTYSATVSLGTMIRLPT